ncbi:hypothetical protein L1049_019591 [Liquidambar formosana]|uniref:GATA transcription factor n=1 Tax=Liquidambar formosana TaxID=63359 RepID=A0AAP0S6V9_LIQFO
MDKHGHHGPDHFRIDDLLDLSNADLFPSTTDHLAPPQNSPNHHPFTTIPTPHTPTSTTTNLSASFTDNLCVPNEDVAELEWLSRFVDDSFSDYPVNELAGTQSLRHHGSVPGGMRVKRSRASSAQTIMTVPPESDAPATGRTKSNTIKKRVSSPVSDSEGSSSAGGVRRCTHCASEKTPQWRTGPLGPKTLCNACGVRYKSGRLVPEYRPAASPTFVLTQHSNSHRKVMELRRQKEGMGGMGQENSNHQQQFYRHPHDFQVC